MMGLLGNVLLLPLAPVQGVLWVARLLQDLATEELDDPDRLRSKLAEAEEAHRRGEISAQELEDVEEAIFTRLMSMQTGRGGMQ